MACSVPVTTSARLRAGIAPSTSSSVLWPTELRLQRRATTRRRLRVGWAVRAQQQNSAEAEAALEARVGKLLGKDRRLVGMSDLSRGYCNSVHLIQAEGRDGGVEELVVKLYSELSTLRVAEEVRGVPDELMATAQLAPRVLLSTSEGIMHQYVQGRTLTEPDMHAADNGELLSAAAQRLAAFHSVPIVAPFAQEPLIWSWLEAMLRSSGAPDARMPDFVTPEEMEREIVFIREALTSVGAPVVFAHGDFKPSNMMLRLESEDARCKPEDLIFIDLELSGPNYRGFDIMKLFRTSEGFSEPNMRKFLSEYLNALQRDELGGVERVYAEARMFEPLTWLEAAVFFVLVLSTTDKPADETARNYALGKQRWEKYLQTKWMVEEYQSRAVAAMASAQRPTRRARQRSCYAGIRYNAAKAAVAVASTWVPTSA